MSADAELISGQAAKQRARAPPDPNALDTWIAVHADNTATLYFGKCELGQGNTTGMLQIAGEELDAESGTPSKPPSASTYTRLTLRHCLILTSSRN